VEGISQLETLLLNAVDKRFDEFELYALQSVFAVPDGLEIELEHQGGVVDGDEAECDGELARLRKRLASVRPFWSWAYLSCAFWSCAFWSCAFWSCAFWSCAFWSCAFWS